jgi:hypothetical protein
MDSKNKRVIKIGFVLFVFFGSWFQILRLAKRPTPPGLVDLIIVLSFGLVIGISAFYYIFLHKKSENQRIKRLNWRQLFVIGYTFLLVAHRVCFALQDLEHGSIDKGEIIQHNTILIIGMLFIGSIFTFLLRDKSSSSQKKSKNYK